MFPLLSFEIAPRKRLADSNSQVWVNVRSGYYCRDSAMYGKLKPGTLMAQREALQAGYSPAQQKHCL